MKKTAIILISITSLIATAITAFAKDDFDVNDKNIYLDDYNYSSEELKPDGDYEFSFVDGNGYDIKNGGKKVYGDYHVSYDKFKISDIEFLTSTGKNAPSSHKFFVKHQSNDDEITIITSNLNDEEFEDYYGPDGVKVYFKVEAERSWVEYGNGNRIRDKGKKTISDTIKVKVNVDSKIISTKEKSKYGITIDKMDADPFISIGREYTFPLRKHNGEFLTENDLKQFDFDLEILSGAESLEIGQIVINNNNNYALNIKSSSKNLTKDPKIVEILTRIRNKGDDGYHTRKYVIQIGYRPKDINSTQFDLNTLDPYIRLDKKIDSATTNISNFGSITFRNEGNGLFNFAYNTDIPQHLVNSNLPTSSMKFYNFTAVPTFSYPVNVRIKANDKVYIYKYNNGIYNEIPTTYENGYRSFNTTQLGEYAISSTSLKGLKY